MRKYIIPECCGSIKLQLLTPYIAFLNHTLAESVKVSSK